MISLVAWVPEIFTSLLPKKCVSTRSMPELTHCCRSEVKILKASGDLYVATVDDKVCVKLGPADWEPKGIQLGGKEPKLAVSGFQ